jgi:tetratricopeptide (TPR) repeat protein
VTTDAALGGEGGRAPTEDQRWSLNDQREFLLRSLEDAEAEQVAGDLTQADYDVLTSRDRLRLAEVEADLAALGPLSAGPDDPSSAAPDTEAAPVSAEARRRGRLRRVGIVAACLLIATGVIILVDHALSPALPGQPLSGSVTLSKVKLIEDELIEAGTLNNDGDLKASLQLYDKVLSDDPTDPDALAASGWLEWNAGTADRSRSVEAAGRSAEKKAIQVAPTYYAGHLYLGLILYNQDHNLTAAIAQFTAFLADSPSKAEVKSVAQLVAAAYVQAKQPVPAALETQGSTTPTTTTPTPTTPTTSAP